jgi:hypothetical protein
MRPGTPRPAHVSAQRSALQDKLAAVAAAPFVIVQIFVTKRQPVDALRQHLFQAMLDPLRPPLIREAARHAPQQVDLAIGLA